MRHRSLIFAIISILSVISTCAAATVRIVSTETNDLYTLLSNEGIPTVRYDSSDLAIAAADKLLASTAAGAEATPEIRSLRAEALDKAGRSIEAEEEWSRLTGNGQTDVYSAKAAVLMSNSLLKRGETERAHKMIDNFINSNPSQQYWLARGFIVLSDILRAEGDDFEADQYLQSLRTNYPGNEADITRMIDERLK